MWGQGNELEWKKPGGREAARLEGALDVDSRGLSSLSTPAAGLLSDFKQVPAQLCASVSLLQKRGKYKVL